MRSREPGQRKAVDFVQIYSNQTASKMKCGALEIYSARTVSPRIIVKLLQGSNYSGHILVALIPV